MATYENDKDYDLIIAVLDGRDKADEFFTAVKSSEASGAFTIKEAATFTRGESGQIRLNNKGYVAGWKGGGIGLGIGILLGGPIGFAAVGGLIGYMRGAERRRLRDQINEKLGPEQSAIALMLEDPIDWDVLREVWEHIRCRAAHGRAARRTAGEAGRALRGRGCPAGRRGGVRRGRRRIVLSATQRFIHLGRFRLAAGSGVSGITAGPAGWSLVSSRFRSQNRLHR